MVAVSACMSRTRGSGVLSSTGDVLEMSVVIGVGGVCDMCMSLSRGGVGGEGGEYVSESVYVDLQYDEISLTFTAGSVCLCGVSSPWFVCEVVVVPLCCECGCCGDCDACTVVCVACVCCDSVTAMLVWGPGEVWLR